MLSCYIGPKSAHVLSYFILKTISSKRRLVECDIWSIRRFADYDVWSTTTNGRKFVELRRHLVEIWSKTDLYRKKIVYIYDPHIYNIFSSQYQYLYICLSCTESSYMPLLGPPIASEKRWYIHFE